jgi:hypothetical protein
MQHGAAVQELHHAGLDRRRPIVWEYDCRHDHVAAVVEGEGYGGPTWPIMSGERVGATATLHPADRDRPAGAEGGNLAAHKIKVAHSIEVVVICDPGCAIAGAELGTQIELKLGAAVGCLARKCATSSPLVDREWPPHLRPDRTRDRAVARPLARRPRCGKRQVPGDRARECRCQRERRCCGLRHSSPHYARAAFASARFSPQIRGPARSAVGPDRHFP